MDNLFYSCGCGREGKRCVYPCTHNTNNVCTFNHQFNDDNFLERETKFNKHIANLKKLDDLFAERLYCAIVIGNDHLFTGYERRQFENYVERKHRTK